MPEMDGLTATSILRERERGGDTHVAVIALTAHAMKDDQDRCLPAGMDGYLTNSTPAIALVPNTSSRTHPRHRLIQAHRIIRERHSLATLLLCLE
jgi:CheY-like chemotaxis protein